MNIAVVGTGYVGLVSGACFAEFGFHVTCLDKNTEKIADLNKGIIPIYEPGLDTMVTENMRCGRLSFVTDVKTAVRSAQVVLIAVGTPTRRGDGHADLSYLFQAIEEIVPLVGPKTLLVTKSTVPVGTGQNIRRFIDARFPNADVEIASNPEFLREGAAITDFMHPDRVVVGVESTHGETLLRQLYRPLFLNETPIVVTTLESSEMIKYAANAFLATKISFINQIANLCEHTDADVQVVSHGIGLDKRIGRYFLHAGPGYGGSCFPKDTLALLQTAKDRGVEMSIVETVARANTERKTMMAQRVIDACGEGAKGKKIGVLGVTFKPNTDDMRDSPSLVIIPALLNQGAEVAVSDPKGRKEGQALLPGVTWCSNPYDVAVDADVVVILTEWNEFRALDMKRFVGLMRSPTIVDLRNVYSLAEMEAAGAHYISIGRKAFRKTPA
ncbi:MAG: UDP-glucose/GDP-mannose dehydrogenase family protein [Alphaproteobacteria bacterium]|nr:MAG: UDP-glucose/GDP-mannose dehydrogenase family protein [Alphaproteobacteria bacterium]